MKKILSRFLLILIAILCLSVPMTAFAEANVDRIEESSVAEFSSESTAPISEINSEETAAVNEGDDVAEKAIPIIIVVTVIAVAALTAFFILKNKK